MNSGWTVYLTLLCTTFLAMEGQRLVTCRICFQFNRQVFNFEDKTNGPWRFFRSGHHSYPLCCRCQTSWQVSLFSVRFASIMMKMRSLKNDRKLKFERYPEEEHLRSPERRVWCERKMPCKFQTSYYYAVIQEHLQRVAGRDWCAGRKPHIP